VVLRTPTTRTSFLGSHPSDHDLARCGRSKGLPALPPEAIQPRWPRRNPRSPYRSEIPQTGPGGCNRWLEQGASAPEGMSTRRQARIALATAAKAPTEAGKVAVGLSLGQFLCRRWRSRARPRHRSKLPRRLPSANGTSAKSGRSTTAIQGRRGMATVLGVFDPIASGLASEPRNPHRLDASCGPHAIPQVINGTAR